MKNLNALSLVLILFLTLGSRAQKNTVAEDEGISSRGAKRRLVLGIKAGANRSNVYDQSGQAFVADPKSGFAGGAYLAIPVGGFLGFQPEVLVSQKGFRATGILLDQPYSLTRTTTYIDVPLQVQLKPFRFLSLLGGVQYSYLMSQRDDFTFGNNSTQQRQEFKNDNIRKNIVGAVCGLDLNIRHVVLSGRACWDVMANHADGSSSTPRYKNLWLQGTIGYRFY